MKRRSVRLGIVMAACLAAAILLSIAMTAADGAVLEGISFTQTTPLEVSKVYGDMPMTIDTTVQVAEGDTGYYSIISNYEAVSKTSLGLSVNGGNPYLYYNFGSSSKVSRVRFTGVKINTGVPTRLTIVYDSTAKTITCYVDGSVAEVIDATTNNTASSKAALQTNFEKYGEIVFVDPHYFGGDRRSGNTSFFKNGTIYSAALYSDARTAEEIAAAQIDTADENLIAAYDFTNANNVLKDLSANGYDITANWTDESAVGMTFSKDTVYTAAKPYAKMPNTFDAVIMLPTDSAKQNAIIGNYDEVANPAVQLEFRKGVPYLYYNAGSNTTARFNFSGVAVNTGVPVRVTVVRDADAGTISCYIDGILKKTFEDTSLKNILDAKNITEIISTNPHALGSDLRSGNTQAFSEGAIYSLALYSDARTSREIAMGQIDLNDENLIAAYELTGANASMADISGNGYDVGIDIIVSFDANGALGAMSDVLRKSGTYTLPASSFVPPSGKTFAGWALTPDGAAIEGDTYVVEDNITFYAVWADMTMPEDGLTFMPEPYYYTEEKLSVLPHTFSAWVFVPEDITGNPGSLLGNWKDNSNPSFGFEIYTYGSAECSPRFHYRTASGGENYSNLIFNNVNLRTGEWAMVTFTVDETNGKTVICYVNGQSCGSKSLKQEFNDSVLNEYIYLAGTASGGNKSYFRGAMKEMALYESTLSADEVAALYQGGTEAVDKALLAHYVLSADDHGKNIADESGNGNGLAAVNRWVQMEDVKGYEYAFALVGDTQIISRDYPEKLPYIYNWIVDNKDEKNIQYVIGLGDITDDNTDAEWTAAKNAISIMDGKVPYSLIRGNHDTAAKFNEYFANETYMSGLEGFYIDGDANNSYDIITAGDDRYLLLNLDYYCNTDSVAWAESVVEAHPDCKVIVSIHAYICNCLGESVLLEKDGPCVNRIRSVPIDSKELWDTFISQHENIAMVLCGHSLGNDIVVLQDEGVNGNTVTQIFANPQTIDNTIRPSGMVAMMYFYPEKNEVTLEYYSTIQECYFKESNRITVSLGGETVEEAVMGDADGNGTLTTVDLAYFQRYLANWNGYETVQLNAMDLNSDGKVNPLDAAILARHLANWIGYETIPLTN